MDAANLGAAEVDSIYLGAVEVYTSRWTGIMDIADNNSALVGGYQKDQTGNLQPFDFPDEPVGNTWVQCVADFIVGDSYIQFSVPPDPLPLQYRLYIEEPDGTKTNWIMDLDTGNTSFYTSTEGGLYTILTSSNPRTITVQIEAVEV